MGAIIGFKLTEVENNKLLKIWNKIVDDGTENENMDILESLDFYHNETKRLVGIEVFKDDKPTDVVVATRDLREFEEKFKLKSHRLIVWEE